MQSFVTFGQDNGLYYFQERDDLVRCESCGTLLRKWEADLEVVSMRRRIRHDVSTSYDGVLVVSERFLEVYRHERMTGLEIRPVQGGLFSIIATREVAFDAIARGTRFANRCDCCGEYESVVGATPAILVSPDEIEPLEFVRTDLEFGSNDAKAPLLICGEAAAAALVAAKLRGLDIEAVGG